MEELTQKEKDAVLKRFMQEFFPFAQFRKIGFFTKEMRGKAQAERVCQFFGYETVYEYGAKSFSCHLTYAGKRPDDEPFITEIKSIYE